MRQNPKARAMVAIIVCPAKTQTWVSHVEDKDSTTESQHKEIQRVKEAHLLS